jgi:PAS domain-containing protein
MVFTARPFEFQHRFRHADAIPRWHRSRALPMRDTKGTITRSINSNTDIDDVIGATFALRRS